MPISTPVPQEYAKPFDAKTPSTYDQYVAFTGPYMYKNDSSGKLVGRKPGRSIELVRNPNWDAEDRLPPRLPGLDHDRGGQRRRGLLGAARSSRARRSSRATARRPAPVIKQALSRNKDQIAFIPGGGYRMSR